MVKIQIMECIAGCFGSKSPNRSRNRKNINSARNDVEPRPATTAAAAQSRTANTTTSTTGMSKHRGGHFTKRTYFDDSEKSDTPLLSRLSDLTDESDLSDPIGLYQNTSKQEYYQSRQRRIGSSQSGPESSSSGPDDSSSYHFSYGKTNGYGIPSIGVPGRAIVIRCENKEIKKSDSSITKDIERRLKGAWNFK